ncbi:ferric reductase-like transmembrane domain-containing protein [Cognatishimia activa]|uniref:ferredoxin reductase family protein n=1 Tax=Cognatishimia activa TaxID=1715691 RepID=UPI00222E31B2|nr:ferric reductase-like transmembrane domain-containing protein [Cognatishimia activa]UZD90311.1 ferric reductase-like transmembrane domain-containing protein [Cognatishimia activa]
MTKRAGIFGIVSILGLFALLHIGFANDEISPRALGATLVGGIAFLLMATSIFLATRPSVLEDAFGGLDRMYQVHKTCGVIATILVLVHFFASPKEIPEGIVATADVTFPSSPLGMAGMILLVVLVIVTLNRKIAYHRWRMPHKLMGVVFVLIVAHFMTAPEFFFDRFGPSGLLLILAGIVGILSYGYSMFGMNRASAKTYVIDAVNKMERATEVVLSPIGDALQFKPGQFAFVEVKGDGFSEPHPFTISSAPDEDKLRFTIKVLGDWTRKVREELTPGLEVDVRGPYGRFDTSHADNKQVWIAGGIGVTPFLSTIRGLKDGDDREIYLVYAVREGAEALFFDELREKLTMMPNMKLILLESNNGEFCKVEKIKEKLGTSMTSFDYFLCGPRVMTSSIIKDLKSEGVAANKIHTEAFEFR